MVVKFACMKVMTMNKIVLTVIALWVNSTMGWMKINCRRSMFNCLRQRVQRNEEIRIMQEQHVQIVLQEQADLMNEQDDDDYFVVVNEQDLMVNDKLSYME